MKEFTEPAAVAVKHMNPCGVGVGTDIHEAYTRAYEADPVSIFGGIIAANREIDKATAEKVTRNFLRNYYCTFFLKRSFRSVAK